MIIVILNRRRIPQHQTPDSRNSSNNIVLTVAMKITIRITATMLRAMPMQHKDNNSNNHGNRSTNSVNKQ